MGLQVDLTKYHNATMADIKDVYLRIETLQVFPKHGFIRFVVTGYVSEASGAVMKSQEISQVTAIQDVFFTRELLAGASLAELGRDEMIPPPQTSSEPVPIFREYYSIYMRDQEGTVKPEFAGISISDSAAIHKAVYQVLKQGEPRFQNIRDVIDIQN
jgi:hypothetical protein